MAAAGQGHYSVARSELAELRRSVPEGPLASLANSTEASLLRQQGWHELARGWDGRAMLLAGADRAAQVDALVGLAADALGVGRFAASARLLRDARGVLGEDAPVDRLAVRVQWVSAELAMATGRGEDALQHAQRSVDLAAVPDISARHRAKSGVVLSAALCCSGRLDAARSVADRLLDDTARLGLIPLRWAVASLLAGIGSVAHSAAQISLIRDGAADLVEHRGGLWRAR